MRNFALLFVFCLFSYSALGQVTSLEEKRGFKKIRLGDHFEKWNQQLSSQGTTDRGLKQFLYTGRCCQKFYNQEVAGILITFQADTIVNISGIIKNVSREKMEAGGETYSLFDPTVFETLENKITYTIGEPASRSKNDNENKLELTTIWKSNNTVLLLTYVYTIENNGQIMFQIYDQSLLKKRAEEGF